MYSSSSTWYILGVLYTVLEFWECFGSGVLELWLMSLHILHIFIAVNNYSENSRLHWSPAKVAHSTMTQHFCLYKAVLIMLNLLTAQGKIIKLWNLNSEVANLFSPWQQKLEGEVSYTSLYKLIWCFTWIHRISLKHYNVKRNASWQRCWRTTSWWHVRPAIRTSQDCLLWRSRIPEIEIGHTSLTQCSSILQRECYTAPKLKSIASQHLQHTRTYCCCLVASVIPSSIT